MRKILSERPTGLIVRLMEIAELHENVHEAYVSFLAEEFGGHSTEPRCKLLSIQFYLAEQRAHACYAPRAASC